MDSWHSPAGPPRSPTPHDVLTFRAHGFIALRTDARRLRCCPPIPVLQGEYPTAPLTDATAAAWTVRVTAHVAAGANGAPAGTAFEASIQGLPAVQTATGALGTALRSGEQVNVTMALAVPAGVVRLWWPNGVFGAPGARQPLYTVALRGPGFADTRRVGFRAIALVTAADSQPAALAGLSGSGNLTLRYIVNGAGLWARGSNVIPLDEFAGRADARALQLHVASAAAAGMNMLLIWGGGIFQYEAFYDAADEAGLLLYHDLMYSSEGQSTHLCAPTETQRREIVANVRRLSSHASVAVWAGGNELGGSGVYASFALSAVREQDASRPLWPASPAAGWATGVDRLWGLPKLGEPLAARLNASTSEQPDPRVQLNTYYMGFQGGATTAHNISHCGALCGDTPGCTVARFRGKGCAFVGFGHPVSAWGMASMDTVWPPAAALPVRAAPAECLIETHGPYTGGRGWPAVNSGNSSVVTPFDPATPPHLLPQPQPLGPGLPAHFHSEFGSTSFSSFESMSATLSGPKNWGAHAPAMYWRSYSQDSIVASYFGEGDGAAVNMSVVGDATVFARQLLLSQLAAALLVKSEVETQRAGNVYGTMLWQLGEIFPTGGWGSLEYATTIASTAGQVRGGRWKPLHYLFESVLFKDVIVACGDSAVCYVRNDSPLKAIGSQARVELEVVNVASGARRAVRNSHELPLLPAGPGAISWFCAGGGNISNGSNSGAGGTGGGCDPWSKVLLSADCRADGSDCILNATVVSAAGDLLSSNPSLLAPPAAVLKHLRPPRLVATVESPAPPAGAPIRIWVAAAAPALFVTLSTLAQGRFSRNAFFITVVGNHTEVLFLPIDGEGDQYDVLRKSLMVLSV